MPPWVPDCYAELLQALMRERRGPGAALEVLAEMKGKVRRCCWVWMCGFVCV